MPKRATSAAPRRARLLQPWPMRGAALSKIAAAFRLRQAVLVPETPPDDDYPRESRTRRAFGDHPDIGRTNHVQILRVAVDELFPEEYLVARGLSARAATQHNDVITEAADVLLSRWERMALFANLSPDRAGEMKETTGLIYGLWEDVAVRMTAYEALFGHLHPFLGDLSSWARQPKLQGCWASIVRRTDGRAKVSKLYENGELDSRTMRALRDGKSLPEESTVRSLAKRLAAIGVRDRRLERAALPCEILVELRFASAVAGDAALLNSVFGPAADGIFPQMRSLLAPLLQPAPDQILLGLLKWGIQSVYWPAVREKILSLAVGKFGEAMASARTYGQRAVDGAGGDVRVVAGLLASSAAERVTELRAMKRRPGDDGPELRLIEFFEFEHEFGRFMQGARKDCPSLRDGFDGEFEADCLYFEVVGDPSLSEAEQERKLRSAVAICEGSADAHRVLANRLAERGASEEALAHYRRSFEINPANVEGRERLLELLARTRAFAEGLVVPADGMSVLYLSIRAACFAETQDFSAANTLATSILADHPRQPIALRVLASCLRAEGKETQARGLERDAHFYDEGVGAPGK